MRYGSGDVKKFKLQQKRCGRDVVKWRQQKRLKMVGTAGYKDGRIDEWQ